MGKGNYDDEKINQMNDKEMVQKWMKSIHTKQLFPLLIFVIHYLCHHNLFSIMIIIFVLTMTK